MTLQDFRNRVDQLYVRGTATLENGELCRNYIRALIMEFGKVTLDQPPYSFTMYVVGEENDPVYNSGYREDIITEASARSYLELLHTFRDELTYEKMRSD